MRTGPVAVVSTLAATAIATVGCLMALCALAVAAQAAPSLDAEVTRSPAVVNRGDEGLDYLVEVTNVGDATTAGTTTVALSFPPGMRLASGTNSLTPGFDPATRWVCRFVASTCSITTAVAPGQDFPDLKVLVAIDPALAPALATTTFSASGGGALGEAIVQDSFAFGPQLLFGLSSFTASANDALGEDYTQAGGHPFSGTASFAFNRHRTAQPDDGGDFTFAPVDSVRDTVVNLPPGFVGNPEAVQGGCLVVEVTEGVCPDEYAVGGASAYLRGFGADQMAVYKVATEKGYPAEFAFRPSNISPLTVVLRAKVRNGDFGVTAFSPLPPQSPDLIGVPFFTFCSYGVVKDPPGFRVGEQRFVRCKDAEEPGARAVPFLTNPTRCDSGPPLTTIDIASYQHPGTKDADGFPDLSDTDWKTYSSQAPEVTGCGQVPFEPSVTVAPTSTAPDSASGLDFDLDLPQDGLLDPDGIATSHLEKTVVELPEGLTVNPSAATGLEGCTDAQARVGRPGQPTCPDGSKLGTVDVTSPLLAEALEGELYLATPKSTDPQSGEMLRLLVVIRNDERGILVKLPGSSVADPQTGRLTATFDQNPQLPFDTLKVKLQGGSRGVLATPSDCGPASIATTLTPWSDTAPVGRSTATDIAGDCTERFAPDLAAGSSDRDARGSGGAYSFRFSREDGEQWLRGLTASLPQGLLASVKDVPLCSNHAADAGACPAASKIGVVDAKAGAGNPFVLEEKGEVFLTEGYKGGAYGLAVKVRPVAGPFRGAMELSPVIVRQAIHVDRSTAQVTAVSDPFPLIHHGIPLRVREVMVLVNRGGFMLNPSDCEPKQTAASLVSAENATASLSDPFQVSGCAGLPFRPKLALSLTGRKQVRTGRHPGVRAVVRQQGIGEAGIEKAVVRLPKSLALDPDNAQALCEFADGTKPDLENHCPKGSIVGRARAASPLLNDPLVGNVYFVKNVRIDEDTGNAIRTLPMIVVALRGEIAVNLVGESSTTSSGKLVNTFEEVPDAPISQFNLNIAGGSKGILAVTRTRKAEINLCAGRHIAEADMDGHNGRRHDRNIRMKTPCTERQTKAAKQAAKRASRRG